MIAAMPRPRPLHLHREVTRHGRVVWFVRKGKGPRIRIKAEFGTPDFEAAYQAALRGEAPPTKAAARAGSLEWLIARYREAPDWKTLSRATQRQREAIFAQIIKASGKQPYTALTEASVAAGRDRRSSTPAQARHFIDTIRGLGKWAKGAGHLKTNPGSSVSYPPKRKSQGFSPWDEGDVAKYEARWPLGSRQRVWLAVLLYTGLRRGDAVRAGRQHVRDGILTLRTEKSQGEIEVNIPLLPPLLEALERGQTGDLAFICGARGEPLTKESFGNLFREACNAAGIKGKSAHGVRKIGATTAANNGATVAQLEAIFGWKGGRMASHYTQSADRRRNARDGIAKLLNDERTSIPAPSGKVRAQGDKTQ